MVEFHFRLRRKSPGHYEWMLGGQISLDTLEGVKKVIEQLRMNVTGVFQIQDHIVEMESVQKAQLIEYLELVIEGDN